MLFCSFNLNNMKGLFIGLTTIDLIYPFKHFPEENSKNNCPSALMEIGGPATNAAFAFTALGGLATLISLLGQNPFRGFMKQELERFQISHIDLNDQAKTNPVMASVLLNQSSGSRTIATTRFADDVPLKAINIDLSDYDVLCVDGFFAEAALPILRKNSRRLPVVFDGGSYKKYTDPLLDYVSHPVFSERFRLPDARPLADYLYKKGIKQFAVTKGEKPLTVFENNKTYELPVLSVKAIDTLAAGDIFHGAFARYIAEPGYNFRSALTKASEVASSSCRFLGPRAWVDEK